MAGINTLLWRIWQGAKFIIQAKTRHGVHSPYVTNFIDAVLKDIPTAAGAQINVFRKKLAANSTIVEISDLGAGYDQDRQQKRQVTLQQIVSSSARSRASGEFLARLVHWKKPTTALELGTNIGFSMLYQFSAGPTTQWHTIEGSPNLAKLAQSHFQQFQINPKLHIGSFQNILPELLKTLLSIDYVLIDGHHTGKSINELCCILIPYLAPEAIVVVDDIRWNSDMYSGWERIQAMPEFSVTIELFQTGICVYSQSQATQHFKLLSWQ